MNKDKHLTEPPCPNGHGAPKPPTIELRLIVTNGMADTDAKLTFQFCPDEAPGRVWIVKLPPIKNADAFPTPVTPGIWELRLQAAAESQPIEVLHYTPQSARQWLEENGRQKMAPAELLILAFEGRFTVCVYQAPN
jgi:hypothetical protein